MAGDSGADTTMSLSRVLAALPGRQDITLAELMDGVGSRAHGTALLILCLPEAIPLPVPSASAILGVPLVLIAADLAAFGEGRGLPERMGRWRVPSPVLDLLRRRVAPALFRAERLSHPRWERIAGREHLVGVVCLYLALVLLLPLPLVNTPPAICMALLAWGMIQRDGAFVAAGLVATALLTAGLAVAGLWLTSLFA